MVTTRTIITLDTYNLESAERHLCEMALKDMGSIIEAAKRLGITRHSLKRRMIKHGLRVPRVATPPAAA